ncbi:MAG: TonB-dependent receptor, partial [Psychrosphaera sp.]|nr:TonB-dependent receptor [Psychrosphaera sp.]
SMPVDDHKLVGKVDWNINDDHRASFVYNYNDGITIAQSDQGSTRISLSNHFYTRGSELKSAVASMYSDWTDNFSTEMRIGKSELDNSQVSIDQASGFGEFRIDAGDVDVYLGPDDSRQSNKLNYETLSMKFTGTYYFEEHQLTFGFEREELDVFNLFVQHSEGEYRFGSIEDYENGVARIYYGNATSQNPNDAAGTFGYESNTAYVQDEYDFIDQDLTLIFGLRYDWYSSNDTPKLNQNFVDRYGFSNQQNLDGKDLLQPRLGFNWSATDSLEIRGGFGLYSGGNPNVWISNSYSNDGISNIQVSERGMQILGPDAVAFNGSGLPGYDIPQSLYDEVGSGTADSSTNVTDPDFEIPSEWKYALGLTYTTDDDYVVTADLLVSHKNDSAVIKNLADAQVATAPDGRPVYDSVNHSRNSDFLLTNVKGRDAESTVVSFGVNKTFDNGLKFSASYAFTEALDVHPMTSSVAFSNYHNIAVSDPENPQLSRSNYEIPHRFTLNLAYTHEFMEGYATKINLFGQANEGRPYGYSFTSRTGGLGFNNADRQLLYVPLMDDPLVVYADGFNIGAFNDFIASEGLEDYRGQIMPRNALDSDWWVKFDLRVEQEFMGFSEDHKASAFFVLENVGNFIKDDWGVMKQGNLLQGAVEAHITDDGQYSYDRYTIPTPQSRSDSASQWEIRVGVKYKF